MTVALGHSGIAQDGFEIVYKVTSGFPDTFSTLTVQSKNGNSLNVITSDKNGRVLFKNVMLKEDLEFTYNYHGDGFSKIDEYFKSDNDEFENYEASFVGEDTVQGIKCKKVSIKINKNLTGVHVWIAEIPEYEVYSEAYVFQFNLTRLNSALKELGIRGFPIRIVCKAYETQTYEFVSAKNKNISPSIFKLNVTREGYSSEYLNKKNQLDEEKFKEMKKAEEAAKKHALEETHKK